MDTKHVLTWDKYLCISQVTCEPDLSWQARFWALRGVLVSTSGWMHSFWRWLQRSTSVPVQCLLSKCGGLVLHPAQKRLIKAAVRCALPASSCSDSRQTIEMPLVPWSGTALQSKLPLVVEWCGAAYLVLLLCCAGLPHPPACANARALGNCCSKWPLLHWRRCGLSQFPCSPQSCVVSEPWWERLFFWVEAFSGIISLFPVSFFCVNDSVRLGDWFWSTEWGEGTTCSCAAMPRGCTHTHCWLFWPSFAWTWTSRKNKSLANWVEKDLRNACNIFFSQREKPGKTLTRACERERLVLSALPSGDLPCPGGTG